MSTVLCCDVNNHMAFSKAAILNTDNSSIAFGSVVFFNLLKMMKAECVSLIHFSEHFYSRIVETNVLSLVSDEPNKTS